MIDAVHWKFKRDEHTPPRALCGVKRQDLRAKGSILFKPRLKSVIGAGYGDAHQATFVECATCKRLGDTLRKAIERDLTIPCPTKQCHAAIGEPCRDLPPHVVHFGRRLKRVLMENHT